MNNKDLSIRINERKEKKMSSGDEKDARPKKPYMKPEVKQVQLRPEEAVLAVCKLPNQYGPSAPGCQTAGVPCYATHS
jgi:hypothetical protein